ncbi:MAG: hypothetical protein PHD17_07100 [Methanothrix soehngenii]|uniref:hypothetical protein n=1 Tax=Methanothrix TaxID=2222 RepID=UPI0023F075F4|nr:MULTISPECIES: hypothetical protein [Methanothrix]MCK9407103.1 hypothetical protein [Methanothrix sp.]MCK9586238.1 hypothetical protein [Methanothrix soehngenii]MDD3552424.1 hypothetical protein [Methanothrix soehngenii]MDD3974436.1 hypothetical protein [Methanothrix soehngenii]MDD4487723.1 hypothetical protein [Methanothrix soehngenii]
MSVIAVPSVPDKTGANLLLLHLVFVSFSGLKTGACLLVISRLRGILTDTHCIVMQ